MFLFLNLKFSGVEKRRKYKKRLKNICFFLLVSEQNLMPKIDNEYLLHWTAAQGRYIYKSFECMVKKSLVTTIYIVESQGT